MSIDAEFADYNEDYIVIRLLPKRLLSYNDTYKSVKRSFKTFDSCFIPIVRKLEEMNHVDNKDLYNYSQIEQLKNNFNFVYHSMSELLEKNGRISPHVIISRLKRESQNLHNIETIIRTETFKVCNFIRKLGNNLGISMDTCGDFNSFQHNYL